MGWTPRRPTGAGITPLLQLNNFEALTAGRPLFAPTTAAFYDGVTVLAGPAKCGKTALLRTLAGLNAFHPQLSLAGTAVLGTMDLAPELKTPERSSGLIAYVRLAAPAVVGTVGEYRNAIRDHADPQFQPPPLWERPMAALSEGQRARVALERALDQDPLLLLVDDLDRIGDPAELGQVCDFLRQHAAGRAIVVALNPAMASVWAGADRVEMPGRRDPMAPNSSVGLCRGESHASPDDFCWLLPGRLGALAAIPDKCRDCPSFDPDRLGITRTLELPTREGPSIERVLALTAQVELWLDQGEVVAVQGDHQLGMVVAIAARVMAGRGRNLGYATEVVIERMGSITSTDRLTQQLIELDEGRDLLAALSSTQNSTRHR